MFKNKQPESQITIRFPDCDPFNHLNNARYIDYFMNAREDHLSDNYNFDLYEHTAKTGKGWAVTKNQILHLHPAKLNETVIIRSVLLDFNRSTTLVEMTMWDDAEDRMKALLWSSFIYFNIKRQRITKHDDDLMDLFDQLKVENDYPATFEERIRQIKKDSA